MISVEIYKNGELLKECESIQDAGRYLQQYTGDRFKRFNAIQNGYCYGDTWNYNGASYTFKVSNEFANKRKRQLESKKDDRVSE